MPTCCWTWPQNMATSGYSCYSASAHLRAYASCIILCQFKVPRVIIWSIGLASLLELLLLGAGESGAISPLSSLGLRKLGRTVSYNNRDIGGFLQSPKRGWMLEMKNNEWRFTTTMTLATEIKSNVRKKNTECRIVLICMYQPIVGEAEKARCTLEVCVLPFKV